MQRALDATGVGLAALCLVHCLALPVAALAMPLAGQLAEAEWVHWTIVALAAPTSLAAVLPRVMDRPFPWIIPVFAIVGVGLLGAAIAFAPPEWEAAFTVAGSGVLVTAHVLNWRRAHRGHRHGRSVASTTMPALD